VKTFALVIFVLYSQNESMEGVAYTTHYRFPSIETCQLFGDMLTNELTRHGVDVKIFCEPIENKGF
jgi:hypothetical protein